MKKTVLAALGVIATVGTVASIPPSDEPPNTTAASQLDTRVDQESSRDTFEYFLSGLGEVDLPQVTAHFESYNQSQAAPRQINENLFQRFIDYKAALQSLDSPDLDTLTPAALQVMHDQLLALQQQFFSTEQQAQLFAEENQLRQLALTRLMLKQQADSEADFQTLWQQELDRQPPDLKASYHNARLLRALQQTNTLSPQARYLEQTALVGPEAADRLAKLSQQRQTFQDTLQHYLARRARILSDPNLTAEEQALEVRQLRETNFPENQLRRVKALESLQG